MKINRPFVVPQLTVSNRYKIYTNVDTFIKEIQLSIKNGWKWTGQRPKCDETIYFLANHIRSKGGIVFYFNNGYFGWDHLCDLSPNSIKL